MINLRIHVCLNHIFSDTAYRWGILPTWTGVKCSLDWPPPMLISRASTPAWTISLGSVPGMSMAVVNPVSQCLCIDLLVGIKQYMYMYIVSLLSCHIMSCGLIWKLFNIVIIVEKYKNDWLKICRILSDNSQPLFSLCS